MPQNAPPGYKLAGKMIDGVFYSGTTIYGVPVGTNEYVRHTLEEKVAVLARETINTCSVLEGESQTLWTLVRMSVIQKFDYWLALCYPSDVKAAAKRVDEIVWSAVESAAGNTVPRVTSGQGWDIAIDVPVNTMNNCTFQGVLTRLKVKIRPSDGTLLQSNTRTGAEFKRAWGTLRLEAGQCAAYLGVEVDGLLADTAEGAGQGNTIRQTRRIITEQRDKAWYAVTDFFLREVADQSCRPALTGKQRDRICGQWLLALPGPVNGLDATQFSEAFATYTCLPTPLFKDRLGEPLGRTTVDLHGDKEQAASLPGDHIRTKHDTIKKSIAD